MAGDVFVLQGSVEVDVNRVVSDLQRVDNQVDQTGNKFKTLGDKCDKIGNGVSNFGGKITKGLSVQLLAAGVAGVKLASDLNESKNKVEATFESMSGSVINWSKGLVKSHGLAQGSALEYVSTMGDMGKSMGLPIKQARDYGIKLTELSSDLASFKNVSIERANTALVGVYTGETEALKSLGIVMTETNLAEFALSQGIKKKTSEMTQAEKVQLRYNYVMSVTKDAQGDFAKTNTGLANSIRVLTANIKEFLTKTLDKLRPTIEKVVNKLNDFVDVLNGLSDKQLDVILKVGMFLLVLGPVISTVGKAIIIFGKISSLFGMISAAAAKAGVSVGVFLLPFIKIIAVVALVVAAIYLVIKYWDELKEGAILLGTAIKDFVIDKFESLKNWLISFITETIPNFINGIIDWFKKLPENIGYIIGMVIGSIIQFGADCINWVTTELPGIIESIVNWFAELPGRIWDWLCDVVTALGDWGSDMLDKANEASQKVVDGIFDWFSELPDKMLDLGKNVVEGLWNGIVGAKDWIWDKISGFGGGIVDGFKDALGIHSPSRVMKDQVGKFMAQGLSIGFTDEMDSVNLDLNKSLQSTIRVQEDSVREAKNVNVSYGRKANNSSLSYEEVIELIKKLLNVTLNIDGREITKAIAPYTDEFEKYQFGR